MKRIVLLLPLFLITMCGEAPVTPPAQACSPPLDGSDFTCPPWDGDVLPPKPPKPLIPTQSAKGEIDVWNPTHFIQMQQMFERNRQIAEIEKNATKPSDAINSALDNFWEKQDGSNGSTK